MPLLLSPNPKTISFSDISYSKQNLFSHDILPYSGLPSVFSMSMTVASVSNGVP